MSALLLIGWLVTIIASYYGAIMVLKKSIFPEKWTVLQKRRQPGILRAAPFFFGYEWEV